MPFLDKEAESLIIEKLQDWFLFSYLKPSLKLLVLQWHTSYHLFNFS